VPHPPHAANLIKKRLLLLDDLECSNNRHPNHAWADLVLKVSGMVK
jgi:hypothetical protein